MPCENGTPRAVSDYFYVGRLGRCLYSSLQICLPANSLSQGHFFTVSSQMENIFTPLFIKTKKFSEHQICISIKYSIKECVMHLEDGEGREEAEMTQTPM